MSTLLRGNTAPGLNWALPPWTDRPWGASWYCGAWGTRAARSWALEPPRAPGGAGSVQAWIFNVPVLCPAGNHMTIMLQTPAGATITVTMDVGAARTPLTPDELQTWAELQCRLMAIQLPIVTTGAIVKAAFEARPLDLTVAAPI